MCGIAGLIALDGRSRAENIVKAMTDALFHRGPDMAGTFSTEDGTLQLGQRRLSIIDLSEKARQPMHLPEEGLTIVFNGEIFNFREIRTELQQRGRRFMSDSDTEVLLHAYAEYGSQMVDQLNGMWAFALYDARRRCVMISRDRIGIKPLYYYEGKGAFIFASEVKGLIASGLYTAGMDAEGLNEYFTFQNVISDRTLFKDVKMLPAGHNLIVELDKRTYRLAEYWDMNYQPEDSYSETDCSEALMEAFHRSMNRHLISDVEIGATISGGMDSSAIVAIASQYINKINTFTGFFDTSDIMTGERCVSEKDDARIIANLFGTTHHERLITAQDMIDTMPALIWHLEDPKVGMCYTFYNISQMVSSKVTVNLSGTGGDELFAGYPWRYSLIENMNNPEEFDRTYFNWWTRLVRPEDKKDLFTEKLMRNLDITTPWQEFQKITKRGKHFTPINRALYYDLKTFLHGFLLVEDKMGMAYSIETRFPFLDKELIDLLSKIPDRYKYANGVSKYILKKAFAKLLPEDIIHKRKQGFTPPDMTWYRRELRGYLRNTLLGRRAMAREYINPKFIDQILTEHDNGKDNRLLIWSLLFVEGWCRTFLANNDAKRIVQF